MNRIKEDWLIWNSKTKKNLILYHTEDRTLETRPERYAAEARACFSGNIIVPNDLDVIVLARPSGPYLDVTD